MQPIAGASRFLRRCPPVPGSSRTDANVFVRCSCEGDSYIDLSTGAYDKLGTRDEGMVRSLFGTLLAFHRTRTESYSLQFDISWSFVD